MLTNGNYLLLNSIIKDRRNELLAQFSCDRCDGGCRDMGLNFAGWTEFVSNDLSAWVFQGNHRHSDWEVIGGGETVMGGNDVLGE
jgi:hypothetical protein